MAFWRALLRSALVFAFLPLELAAQDATLSAKTGSLELSGRLLGFDGENYRLQTRYGEITVKGNGVHCSGDCPDIENFVARVVLSGSPAMGTIMIPAMIEGFALRNQMSIETNVEDKGVTHIVLLDETTGTLRAQFVLHLKPTDAAFADLMANKADLVMARRQATPEEREQARKAGMGDLQALNQNRVLALDAIIPIVAPGNPVQHVSLRQIADILQGKLTNWYELGGPAAPITIHIPGPDTGFGQALDATLLQVLETAPVASVVQHSSAAEVLNAVMLDPLAIGLARFSDIGAAQPLSMRGECGFEMAATRDTIKTEDYPLTAPLFLYKADRRLPKIARDFLAFTRGRSAQLIARRVGYVDQLPSIIPIQSQGNRFANAISAAGPEISLQELQRMTRTLSHLTRLSPSFRFFAGSDQLDATSRSNVRQLGLALNRGDFNGRHLVIVGFSDAQGPANANRDIALRRAEAVLRAVRATLNPSVRDRVKLSVDAFGEALPMACDDTPIGRKVNRRVEVWVR